MSAATRVQRQRWWWWGALGLTALVLVVAFAGTAPTSGVSDERLFALAERLKCQQCVGESVAGSQSPSAVQFREEIAAQMGAGRTDDEILNFFVDRYGREVLLNPPSSGLGSLVWIVPVVAGAAALLALAATFRRWRLDPERPHATRGDEERVARALRARSGSARADERG